MDALRSMLPAKPFFVPRQQVEDIKSKLGLNNQQLLEALVPIAAEYARPGISGYHVGEAGLGAHGDLYLACNLEFPGQAGKETVHGEHFMVANALAHGETQLKELAFPAPPCGGCRQLLFETQNSDQMVIYYGGKPHKLSDLLPDPFGPGGTLLQPQNNKEHLIDVAATDDPRLLNAALQATNRAYAARNHMPAGVALHLRDGSIYPGSFIEVSGQNPSLSPLQGALIAMVADGKPYSDIDRAILLEEKNPRLSQLDTTEYLLHSVAPQAALTVRHVARD